MLLRCIASSSYIPRCTDALLRSWMRCYMLVIGSLAFYALVPSSLCECRYFSVVEHARLSSYVRCINSKFIQTTARARRFVVWAPSVIFIRTMIIIVALLLLVLYMGSRGEPQTSTYSIQAQAFGEPIERRRNGTSPHFIICIVFTRRVRLRQPQERTCINIRTRVLGARGCPGL